MPTTITLSEQTKAELAERKRADETWDEFLRNAVIDDETARDGVTADDLARLIEAIPERTVEQLDASQEYINMLPRGMDE